MVFITYVVVKYKIIRTQSVGGERELFYFKVLMLFFKVDNSVIHICTL